jgi:hypothetical protein
MTRVLLLTALVAGLQAPPPLVSHDLWIEPSSFTPAPGEPVRLHLVLGNGKEDAGAEKFPRADAGILRFVAIGPDGDRPVPGLDGLDPAGFLRPTTPGWYTILYESSPSFGTLAPDTFRAYLLEKGLESVASQRTATAAAPAEPTTELFRRSIKARILVAEPGRAAPTDSGGEEPAGLPFELVLEKINGLAPSTSAGSSEGTPTAALAAPSSAQHQIVMRLLLDGAPVADALVDIRRLEDREVGPSARTDADGRLRVSLSSGSWLATAVHLDASRPATADWESLWASLTFELR